MSERPASFVVATIGVLFAASAVRYSAFVGPISDGSGYVSEAYRWLAGQLIGPLTFSLLPQWPNSWFELPLGYRPGLLSGTDVFTYPPGYPLAMAGAMWIGGRLAAHVVAPVLGGLLVWATADLAGQLAGRSAAVFATALMATSAIALQMAVAPMSDLPAAAWWALSLALAARGSPGRH